MDGFGCLIESVIGGGLASTSLVCAFRQLDVV